MTTSPRERELIELKTQYWQAIRNDGVAIVAYRVNCQVNGWHPHTAAAPGDGVAIAVDSGHARSTSR